MDKPSLSSIKIFLTCHFRHQDVAWIPVEQAKHDDVTANEYKSNEDDYDEDALLYRNYDEFRDIDECVTDQPTDGHGQL